MTKITFEPGIPVCYKCGSPTFIFLRESTDGDAVLTWFDTLKNQHVTFVAPFVAIETIEDFHRRKIRIEAENNKRFYEVPAGIDLENILTIGFLSAEHKQVFMDKMFAEQAPGEIFSKEPKKSIN